MCNCIGLSAGCSFCYNKVTDFMFQCSLYEGYECWIHNSGEWQSFIIISKCCFEYWRVSFRCTSSICSSYHHCGSPHCLASRSQYIKLHFRYKHLKMVLWIFQGLIFFFQIFSDLWVNIQFSGLVRFNCFILTYLYQIINKFWFNLVWNFWFTRFLVKNWK